MQTSNHHYLYFILDEPFVKIGTSNLVSGRQAQLQTGNPRELQLLATMRFKSQAEALSMERIFHKSFAPVHERGEWFNYERIVSLGGIGKWFVPNSEFDFVWSDDGKPIITRLGDIR